MQPYSGRVRCIDIDNAVSAIAKHMDKLSDSEINFIVSMSRNRGKGYSHRQTNWILDIEKRLKQSTGH